MSKLVSTSRAAGAIAATLALLAVAAQAQTAPGTISVAPGTITAAPGLLTAAPVAAPAGAPAAGGPVIAVVNSGRVMQQSTAWQGVQAQGEKYEKSLEDAATQIRAKLDAQEKDLETQRASLTPQALDQKERDFNNNFAEQQREFQARQQALQQSMDTALGKVNQAAIQAVRQVAEARGANFVFDAAALPMYDSRADITDQVAVALNKILPHTDVPPPKVTDVSAAAPQPQSGRTPTLIPGGIAAVPPGAGLPEGGLNLSLPSR